MTTVDEYTCPVCWSEAAFGIVDGVDRELRRRGRHLP
jgi:hypothetical protein